MQPRLVRVNIALGLLLVALLGWLFKFTVADKLSLHEQALRAQAAQIKILTASLEQVLKNSQISEKK